MFTIKYRYYVPSRAQPEGGPIFYDEQESINGPYEFISQERDENGYQVVYAHHKNDPTSPPMTFGPFQDPSGEDALPGQKHPRPTLWVMNDAGATVAKYDL